LSNKIRDMQEAVVYMASQDGFKSAVKTGFRDPISVNDVKNFILGKETAGTKLYAQMIEDGGTTGGMALSTRKQIEETLQNIRSTNRSIARKGFKALAESVDKWNTVFEDSTRLSAYKTALESGMSREKAAIMAKNVSIDFNEFGTWGPIINSMYMFANASIQGSAKMIRAMKNPKVATAVVGTVGTAVFAANSWNDKVDPEWRNKVSKWDKLNGLNIVIPRTEEFYYISIPVSWGLKPIKVAMEYRTDVLSGQTGGLGDATEGIFTAVLEGYNPVGGTDLASALTPSPIEPFIDIARNRQWTGGKLRPDWNKYAPASTQYFKDLKDSTTGKYLISISQSIAEKTGGRIEISPADAEYVLQQITGGPGKFTGKVFNSVSAIGKGEVPEVRDIPFLSRVFRKTPEERFYVSKGETDIIKTLTEQERKGFYDKQEAEIIFEELKKMPVEQRKETYKKLKEEKPQLIERVNKIADDEEKNLSRLDRQLLDLGVENGARAKYLFEVFKSAKPQEKKELYQEYLKKGIISDNVKKQLDYLFTH
ncbi:MAG: LPD38 domain-containing protein, partial [Nanoarchaeota archaeon]